MTEKPLEGPWSVFEDLPDSEGEVTEEWLTERLEAAFKMLWGEIVAESFTKRQLRVILAALEHHQEFRVGDRDLDYLVDRVRKMLE
jgi:hypothetical protein